ncbi:HNH endonuclease [Blastococcus sp. PRF04-17]|nr:HNH endonuclease signature motif containing protein [Blastococcus sp. PRF04-17]UOY04000.1 HNH endonuclease [Blastococcus sp. PRF04-17]
MAVLEAAVDALAGESLDGLGDHQHLERTARLTTLRNRLEAELARTVRRADTTQAAEHDGLKSMRSWLRSHARLSAGDIGRLVRVGRAVDQLPAVATGFAAGAITADQVALIAPVAGVRNQAEAVGQGIDLAAVDRLLAEVAATRPHAELAQVVHHYLARLDPDGPEPDPTEDRSLTLSKHADGSLSIRGELDAVGGEKLQAALESIVQADRPNGDTRSRAQQQADALVQLADNALAAGQLPILRTVKPHVAVRIDLDDLVDPAAGPAVAEMGFGAQISAARARMLACDGSISRIVFGPDGHPLDLGRSHRVVPPSLRRTVEHRDGGCVFAGCGAPTHWCDVHHFVHWADGGETSLDNSALLCERHHTKAHHGFRVERQPDGRWHTHRPDGTEILIGQPL